MTESDKPETDELLLVCEKLKQVIAANLADGSSGHTLPSTDVVHEAYLRLLRIETMDIADRPHFFALAAGTLRRILVDRARCQLGDSQNGTRWTVAQDADRLLIGGSPEQVLGIDEVLDELKERYPRHGQLVELRFFGGLSETEAARVLGITREKLVRDWHFVRLWLFHRLTGN